MIQTLFTQPLLFLVWIVVIIYGITIHEFSHVLAAKWLGDDTGERLGRLSLNPLTHIDTLGLVLLVIAGFGWGKPAPFNPANFQRVRNAKLGTALVALGGPLANLISVAVFLIASRLLLDHAFIPANSMLVVFLGLMITINLMLMIFNLIPIPPLDGSKILFGFLPFTPVWQERQRIWEEQGPWILMLLILLDTLGGLNLFRSLFDWALTLISPLAG